MNINQPLVSMITYCYNGERFVHKYFEAILTQTYKNIELIFINNGSTDRTGEIAQFYGRKLEERNIRVEIIHYQENQNTCLMKQVGFSHMHGDFFFGCDSDDIIHPTYIEEMSGYLIAHPDKGIVFCQLNIVLEETGEVTGLYKVTPNTKPKGAFEDLLQDRNTYYTAISYMISRKKFLECNQDFKFAISDYGENPQIQMPLLYHDLQGYIEKPLGNYTVRKDSYSGHFRTDYNKQVLSSRDAVRKMIDTLDRIQPSNREYYESIIKKTWFKNAFYASLHISDRHIRREVFREFVASGGATIKERIIYFARPLYLRITSK